MVWAQRPAAAELPLSQSRMEGGRWQTTAGCSQPSPSNHWTISLPGPGPAWIEP